MKYIYLLFSTLFLSVFTAFSQSINPLSSKDQKTSSQFIASHGTDRVELFKSLQPLVRLAEVSSNELITNNSRIGAKTTTLEDLKTLFGEPDIYIQRSLVEYYLKAQPNKCKAVFGIDKNNFVSFVTIKDCN